MFDRCVGEHHLVSKCRLPGTRASCDQVEGIFWKAATEDGVETRHSARQVANDSSRFLLHDSSRSVPEVSSERSDAVAS
jgi:hypothetical protein